MPSTVGTAEQVAMPLPLQVVDLSAMQVFDKCETWRKQPLRSKSEKRLWNELEALAAEMGLRQQPPLATQQHNLQQALAQKQQHYVEPQNAKVKAPHLPLMHLQRIAGLPVPDSTS